MWISFCEMRYQLEYIFPKSSSICFYLTRYFPYSVAICHFSTYLLDQRHGHTKAYMAVLRAALCIKPSTRERTHRLWNIHYEILLGNNKAPKECNMKKSQTVIGRNLQEMSQCVNLFICKAKKGKMRGIRSRWVVAWGEKVEAEDKWLVRTNALSSFCCFAFWDRTSRSPTGPQAG